MQIINGLKSYYHKLRGRARSVKALYEISRFPKINGVSPKLESEVIVSITSYPPRFVYLSKTIKSIIDQTCKADRIILWLSQKDAASLPSDIKGLCKYNFEIRLVEEDLKSYDKLVHALIEFPNEIIVTADDDVYYGPDWLDVLVSSHKLHPADVVCWRAHRIDVGQNGETPLYSSWVREVDDQVVNNPTEALFPTGVGGILYPPATFDDRATDIETFTHLAPHADDIWFFWMQLLRGVKQRRVYAKAPLCYWPGSQKTGLQLTNVFEGGNDRQRIALEYEFGKLSDLLAKRSERQIALPFR